MHLENLHYKKPGFWKIKARILKYVFYFLPFVVIPIRRHFCESLTHGSHCRAIYYPGPALLHMSRVE